jgi:TRAP-type C4-dicarboxylate transport system substrate-binding protein
MKRNKILALIAGICLVMLLAVTACAAPTTPTPTTPAPTTPAPTTPAPTTPAPTQEKFDWRMGNLYPRAGLPVRVAEDFENKVFAMSDGRLKVTTYYAGEIAVELETLQACASGLTEMAFVYPASYAGIIPAAQIEMGLPGVPWDTVEQQAWYWEFQDGAVAEIIRDAYAEQGLYWINFGNQLPPIAVSKEPLNSVDDFVGLKIRAMGIYADFMNKLGAKATSIAFDELYTAMATGVVDAGCGFNMVDYYDAKFYEVCPYLFPLTICNTNGGPMIVNMDAWNTLPDDLKAILDVVGTDNMWLNARAFGYFGVQDWVLMQEEGAQLGPAVTDADRDKWLSAGLEIWDDYAKLDAYCGQLIPMLKDYMKELGYMK